MISLNMIMRATEPKLVVLAPSAEALAMLDLPCAVPPLGIEARHPCEHCKCCACHRLCTKCKDHCRPTESYLIPVVYCPDFIDIRTLKPVRYLYRSGYECEYRLRLPRAR